jgi:ribosomal protein S18 acetylase RimI-like enzyme
VRLAERIDAMADAAFPPAQRAGLGGWILRADPATHRRTRSVWAREDDGDDLSGRITRAEEWYAEHGLSARFQLTPASRPAGLEDELARRGYAVESPSAVWTGELGAIADDDGDVAVADRFDDRWLQLSGADTAVLERVGVPCGYARSPLAAARGALQGDWLGIFEVATLPQARRRGAASAVVAALAAWGCARGARRAYMLVREDNAPAHALYARLGFSRAYAYRYRVREVTRASRPGGAVMSPPQPA